MQSTGAPRFRSRDWAADAGPVTAPCVRVGAAQLDEARVLSPRKGGSLLADARAQPPVAGAGKPPEPGVYVRGIWVRKPLIDGVLMCFDGKAGVEVTGRDRNDVDADAAAEATLRLLQAS